MTEKFEGAAFVGARKLDNGGVVFDCINEKTALWVRGEETMKEFIAALGGTCVFKPRTLGIVVKMMPVELDIGSAGVLRLIERESGLKAGVIVTARWLKPLHRRMEGQRVAHAVVELVNAEAANHLIDNGVFTQGKFCKARKPVAEVQRCLKCQKFDGHFVQACKSTVDVCCRCAGNHRTSDCTILDSGMGRRTVPAHSF
ncbi:hypothetical protein B0H16DRAFT_1308361 [Mycena metata]|uniref:Uncharacterized protein n=1 Tax=Mycena metata TaxID=1033252 RepID=A0AAD7JNA5_9AGAR|nr:hypothetical protein B0H16DRAFT_1308361 [Mycena metata]